MNGNLVSNNINNNFAKYFEDLAKESFMKEKKLYNKIWEEGDQPQDVKQLYGKVSEIYYSMDKIVEDNNFLNALRSNYFYNQLVVKIISNNNNATKKLIGSNTIHDFIQQNIKEKAELRDDSSKSRHTINTLRSVIYQLVKTQKKDITYEDIMDIKIEDINIDIEEDSNNNLSGIKIRRRKSKDKKRGLILWDEKDTSNLLKMLEKKFEINFKEKGENFYILDNQKEISSEDQNNTLVGIFISTLKNKFPKSKSVDNMVEWLSKNQITIDTRLNQEKELRDLLLGGKSTMKEVKGDIGELIVNLVIGMLFTTDNIYKDAENFFGTQLGDKNLGTGKMAVDLALQGIGFQVKNFPSFENQDDIYLYHQSNLLYADSKVYINKEDGNRYMSNDNWIALAKYGNGDDSLKDDILNILKESLPNYLRYSENIIQNLPKELETLSQLRNNFYIINFRIIPASVIFHELAQLIINNSKDEILKMFYYTANDEDNFDSKKMILTDEGKKEQLMPKKNLFNNGKVYFVFKGIRILKQNDLKQVTNLVQF